MKETTVTRLARETAPWATEIRHQLHRRPEIAMKEYETTALIRRELTAMGVEQQDIGMETGAVGLIRGTKPGGGTVVGLRADIDALPMEDLSGRAWASEIPGMAHTCGHDAHTACLLGAAKVLMQLRDRFSGTVKLVFQPGEEGLHGARVMVAKGVMENPHVDMMIGIHGTPIFPIGSYAVSAGQIMAASDRFLITFRGKSAHASRPVEGRNALVAAAHTVVALQEIVSNEISTREQAVVNTCICRAGAASNIIPDTAILQGTVRTLSPAARQIAEEAIGRMAASCAALSGCSCEMEYRKGCPPVCNHPEITEAVRAAAGKIVTEDRVLPLQPIMGGEDFSLYTEVNPRTAFFRVGSGAPEEADLVQLHNAHYDFDDRAIPYGIAAHVQFVLDQAQ